MNPNYFELTMYQWAGYLMLAAGFLLTMMSLLFFYFRLIIPKKNQACGQYRPISVLLTIRNEEERIRQILEQLLLQDYPDFEVVVVDDFSEDSTLTIIGVMAKDNPRLKFTSLRQETRYSEKLAINLAMKAASYDWVVLVSPDTVDLEPDFLKRLCARLPDAADLSGGYVNYVPMPGVYNRLCRIEKFYSFITTAGFSVAGRSLFFQQFNVLFNKKLYFDVDGFRGWMNDHYAHLELIFNHISQKNVTVSAEANSRLAERTILGKADFAELVRKRILLRQNLTGAKKLSLWFRDFTRMLFFAGLLCLLIWDTQNWIIYSSPVLFIVLLYVLMVKTLLKRLNEPKIFISSLVYVLVKPLVTVFYRVRIYYLSATK